MSLERVNFQEKGKMGSSEGFCVMGEGGDVDLNEDFGQQLATQRGCRSK